MRLVERVPWCLDWTRGVKGVWVLFEEVRWSQLLYTLNGSVVALVGDLEDESVERLDGEGMDVDDAMQGQAQLVSLNSSFHCGCNCTRQADHSTFFLFLWPSW